MILSVADTGVGIPEHELPHIFERFHRVAGTRGRTYEGTGIGLALILELAKLHGGTVKVESREGHGSTFTVAVPLGSRHLPQDRIGKELKGHSSTAVRTDAFIGEAESWITPEAGALTLDIRSKNSAAVAASDRPRILLADDNADMREYVRNILGPQYEVVAVAGGRQARSSQNVSPGSGAVRRDDAGLDSFACADCGRKRSSAKYPSSCCLRAPEKKHAPRNCRRRRRLPDQAVQRPRTCCPRSNDARSAAGAAKSREQFETLLNQSPIGVYLIDANFRIRQINPTALPVSSGIPDLIGRDFAEVIHLIWPTRYAEEVVRIFRHTLDTGEPYFAPERIEQRRDRGTRECYEWRTDRIRLPDGFGVVCYFRDVSPSRSKVAKRSKPARKSCAAPIATWSSSPIRPVTTCKSRCGA